jgi:hypothetical protein
MADILVLEVQDSMKLLVVRAVHIQVAKVGNHNPVEAVVVSMGLMEAVDRARAAAEVATTVAHMDSAVPVAVLVVEHFAVVGSRFLAVKMEGIRSHEVPKGLLVADQKR